MFRRISFRASGHENIRASHRTTLMTTTENHLTLRGNCIICVNAEKGLRDLPQEMKKMAKNSETVITLSINVGAQSFTVKGRGDPKLTYSNAKDIVARKSSYTCDRTLMVNADKAAHDMDKSFVSLLRGSKQEIMIVITTEL